MSVMIEKLQKMLDNAFELRLKRALKYLHGGRSFVLGGQEQFDWITIELLEKHKTFPYRLAPNGHRTYVMNLKPEGVDLWSVGKMVQRREDFGVIDFETIAEIQAGYWEFLRHECGLTEEE